jgi:hypothetical protein
MFEYIFLYFGHKPNNVLIKSILHIYHFLWEHLDSVLYSTECITELESLNGAFFKAKFTFFFSPLQKQHNNY